MTRRNEDLKEKGGGRLKHCNVDGDVPLCLRSFDEGSKDGSSSKKNGKEWMVSGSSVSNSMKNDSRSKMTSGSKDLCSNTTEEKNQENGKQKSKHIAFIVLQKTSDQSTQVKESRIWCCQLESYRWDEKIMSETWRPNKSEIWETPQIHNHGRRKI